MPSDGRKKNLLDLIRTYKNKENSTKTGGDGTTTKTTTYAKKKLMQISRKKKRKYSFFHLTIRKNSTNYEKKTTIHHHIKKSHTHFKMISNHQRTVLKLFMKKEKCMRKSTKKNIDEIPPIHINFYLKSSSLICQSYISISLLFWAPMCVLACLKLSFHKTKMIPPQFFYPPDLWKN